MFKNNSYPQGIEEDKEDLDNPIEEQDICKAIKQLPNGKTPGSDGLPVEFYKVFWINIKKMVTDSINRATHTGEMSIEQRRGILSLVPKKDKDVRRLKNWRPIALLNADYKIMAKILAMRLQVVIPYLISTDQSGCIKGRSTFNNIRSMIDVIDHVNMQKLPGIMFFIDYEKAFDTVSWNFLYKTLKALNFGPFLIDCIKMLYRNINTCVTNNGHLSQFFHPSRGIRQGCPASALLFILIVETLANSIRNNNRINGIKINRTIFKISQYADDTCLFLADEGSLSLVLIILDKFSKCSGLVMNRDKSEALWIGISSNYRHRPCNLRYATDSVRCLGVLINNNTETMIKENCTKRF